MLVQPLKSTRHTRKRILCYNRYDHAFNYNIIGYRLYSQVYFWVLNKDEEFKKAFELGATGVMTDYPTRLKLFLKNHTIE